MGFFDIGENDFGFDRAFDFNRDGKLDFFEQATRMAIFSGEYDEEDEEDED